ncbi:MAG TPA: hypothetical protein EYH57_09840 [Sulfurovum sp.]|nr:hypothetical protein [Sulfurovum sp.]
MYKREEHIEEENLDWEKSQTEEIEKKTKKTAHVIFTPNQKSKQSIWQSIATFDMQAKSKHFVEKNIQLSSFMGVLLLPYFVGFIILYLLFYTYGGMSLMSFLNLDTDFLLLHLWSIGAYIFITLWVFGALTHILQSSKMLLSPQRTY